MESSNQTLTNFSKYLENSGCMKCTARCADRKRIPKSFFTVTKCKNPTIAIILSHPRSTDEEEGRILKGADRLTMLKWFSQIDTVPSCYFTSAVKCRTEGDRSPKKEEIITCTNNHLLYELAVLQPKVIVAMGKVAIKALFNCTDKRASDMTNSRFIHKVRTPEQIVWEGTVYTTYHPGFFKMGAGDTNIDDSLCIETIRNAIKENAQ